MNNNTHALKEYLSGKMILTGEDWALIEAVCTIKKLRKHQYLLQEGDVWKYHAFIAEGCLRRYKIDDNGVEHTLQFSPENWWAGDRESLMNGTPSKYNIDAIEASTVILIKNADFDMLCKQIPAFNDFINLVLQRSLNASQERILTAISMNAEEKYLHFINTYPQLNNRLPRHMLASFLGITPESLSRVKSKLTKR
ncbi:Crp/Fnr family transcriptional regulator [Chitinophagaceae bacterium MMS25-I14]